MKSFYQFFLLEQTVWIPIVLMLVKFKHIHPRYLPLFIYLLARAILEITGNLIVIFVVPQPKFGNAPFYNIAFLLEAVLITVQLHQLTAFRKHKKFYHFIIVFWILLWLSDNFYIGSLDEFNLTFHTAYSFILLFVITSLISKLAISKKQNIYRSADFWICIGFALWFIYSLFYAFSKYLVVQYKQLFNISGDIIKFMEFAEVILYLILAWAIYCILPKRKLYATN